MLGQSPGVRAPVALLATLNRGFREAVLFARPSDRDGHVPGTAHPVATIPVVSFVSSRRTTLADTFVDAVEVRWTVPPVGLEFLDGALHGPPLLPLGEQPPEDEM